MAHWGIGEELNHKRFKANRAMELLKREYPSTHGVIASESWTSGEERGVSCR